MIDRAFSYIAILILGVSVKTDPNHCDFHFEEKGKRGRRRMDSDEEDFVFYGTSIEREEDVSSRKKKAVAQASGQLRTLPSWKQEVRDEEGRRRFHGAFTGGFSAGYYNTVGSKEGWTPQSFTSSRKNRAEIKQQSVYHFLDEDEKAELEGGSLGTSTQFDTFGFTAAELAHKQAEKEQQQRPSAIPGPVPDELIVPATDSIGVKLLLKMGWRRGRSIKDACANSLYDARRQARKAFLALSSDDARTQLTHAEVVESDTENVSDLSTDHDIQYSKSTPVYDLNPKQDLHGLGFDPFKHAPEFREKKKLRLSGAREPGHGKTLSTKDSLFGFKSGRAAAGFGIGALEDLDVEDEDIYASGFDFEDTYIHDIEEPSRLAIENKKRSGGKEQGVLPGFKVASNSDYQVERFNPPVIPKDFVPHHKFPASLEVENKLAGDPPPEVPPPEDNNLKVLIEGVATLVARCGKLFEDLSREKNRSSPLFSFLNGGNGHDYYARKLWEERQKRTDQTKEKVDGKVPSGVEKMTAEGRGKILGEKPLERSNRELSSSVTSADTINLQFNLSDTFTKPASFNEPPEVAKPFQDDPAKQKRFELFLKEKYQGGLRSKDAGGASNMSEAARARERLEFEAAADAIEKGQWGKESKPPSQPLVDVLVNSGLLFTSGGSQQDKVSPAEELVMKKMYPKREEFQWRPSPILCKRFDIIDPYMGKPPPGPRVRSKMDSLIFMPNSVKASKVEEIVMVDRDPLSVLHVGSEEKGKKVTDRNVESEVEVENVERPVDLYKAIFSDDSDEEENPGHDQVEDPQKKIDVANTTLNRLIAGDFLESLGKELGLEVPPNESFSESNAGASATHVKSVNNKEESNAPSMQNNFSSVLNAVTGGSTNQVVPQGRLYHQESTKHEFLDGDQQRSDGETMRIISSENRYVTNEPEKEFQEVGEAKTPSGLGQRWNGSTSEDERSRKRSRHHRRKHYSSCSETPDSSEDYRERYHSRSQRKRSSREKSHSRKHSKYRHGSEKENRVTSRQKQKYKD